MRRYFLGLGSNIAPHTNFGLMLRELLTLAPIVHVGRVIETAPVGVVGDPFLNTATCLDLDCDPQTLKQTLNAIETRLGRDRTAPGSKTRSRTADLDIICWLDPADRHMPATLLPDEPYTRPMLLELLAYLGITTEAETPELGSGVALDLAGQPFGLLPTTFNCKGNTP
ncbi:MAG: 2-amino-4-hydroxy-6-hydroxymethyldihydropteridine diphosphokinase [Oscillochloridaceae bacterium umkhey_bin13]